MRINNLYSPQRLMINAEPGVIAILCRHGSTESNDNLTPRVRGWVDIELDEKGRIQAQLLADKLRRYNPKEIIHSDFARDSQTASIIAEILNIPTETEYNCRTWDVGIYSGRPIAEVNPSIEVLYKNPWEKPPGSDESYNDFSSRFISLFDNKLRYATIEAFRPIVIVTHGKNIALVKTYIEGGNAWESTMPMPAGMAVITVGLDKVLAIDIIGASEPVIEDK